MDVTAGYAVASIRFIRRIDIFEAFHASGDPRSSRGRGWKTGRGSVGREPEGLRRAKVGGTERVERHGFAPVEMRVGKCGILAGD